MDELDKQDKRIAAILNEDEPPEVTCETLRKYLTHLRVNIVLPCSFTGIEDFDWEERYVIGGGDKKEYEKLKKTRPSYTDVFLLLSFSDDVDEMYGIFVKVKRASDKKQFTLPLADLEVIDTHSSNFQLVDDFSVWFVNDS